MKKGATVLNSLSSTRFTRVFRCTLRKGICRVATMERFVGANGMAISHDRGTVFVNDPSQASVIVMKREEDGELTKVSELSLPHLADNIEMTDDGKLSAGTIPLPYACGMVCSDAKELSASKMVDGRQVGCGRAPGTLMTLRPVQQDDGLWSV